MARYFNNNVANYLSGGVAPDAFRSVLMFCRARVDPAGLGAQGVIWGFQGAWLQIAANRKFGFNIRDGFGTFQTIDGSYIVDPLEWHSLCVVDASSSYRFYIDGKRAGTGGGNLGLNFMGTAPPLVVGRRQDSGLIPFYGAVADCICIGSGQVGIADELDALVLPLHYGVPPTQLALRGSNGMQILGWYPLDENGTTIKDKSNSHGPLTVNGTVPLIEGPPRTVRPSINLLALAAQAPNTDAGTGLLTFTVSGTETPGLGSLGTEVLALTPITTYEGLNSEFGTDDFKLTPSGSDVQDIHDTNSEYFDLQPSGAEAAQYPLVEATTEYFDLQPSGVDVLGKQYLDSGTVLVDLQVETHECYVHGTPEYEIDLFKKWLMQINKQWEVTNLQKRWSVSVLPGALEIPC